VGGYITAKEQRGSEQSDVQILRAFHFGLSFRLRRLIHLPDTFES
jgi:hypothetical protein